MGACSQPAIASFSWKTMASLVCSSVKNMATRITALRENQSAEEKLK